MRAIKIPTFRRDPDAPTIRERAASLKAKAARFISHKPAEADPQRRAMMATGLAAAVTAPLPALAAPIIRNPAHPDRALFEAHAAHERAEAVCAEAKAANAAAWRAYAAALSPCPEPLLLTPWERRHIAGSIPVPPFGFVSTERVDHPAENGRAQREAAWTEKGLRAVIAKAPGALGPAGRTPHLFCRRPSLATRTATPCARGSARRSSARRFARPRPRSPACRRSW